jgi:hypothetical protein
MQAERTVADPAMGIAVAERGVNANGVRVELVRPGVDVEAGDVAKDRHSPEEDGVRALSKRMEGGNKGSRGEPTTCLSAFELLDWSFASPL